ncbi:MAG: hypothetical protein COW00_09680 [Bdellovibrio sp. CG12_big_fil_rev_8_21_14_0_65_39_13]|nr:MAG: hypothetical protein COW78_16015 [Bdellovibrio sp. CG22_combo_CG10-13_8_21_14_all_39_27]PIQ59569.1 MAG: hypothetical protein COW00_09680 [Bdellovibrio sp. CG12_big_fil_rev_8_21_14_0_65_39_13]PIR33195.1 MAG: hypothetical protein COV37_17265 [Bdellovibrio sp. CG11_big_fil_rev_8_21_14_0_20_39_38]
MNILLVDDDILLGTSFAEEIQHFSSEYDVTFCCSALLAIELIRQNSYDLIVSDYHMPEMNGVEFWYHLKKTMGLAIPFIFHTSDSHSLKEKIPIESSPMVVEKGLVNLLNAISLALSDY